MGEKLLRVEVSGFMKSYLMVFLKCSLCYKGVYEGAESIIVLFFGALWCDECRCKGMCMCNCRCSIGAGAGAGASCMCRCTFVSWFVLIGFMI